MILSQDENAMGAITVAQRLLKDVNIGISAIAGKRQVYVVGRLLSEGFNPRFLAMDPHNPKFELQIVESPAISTEE